MVLPPWWTCRRPTVPRRTRTRCSCRQRTGCCVKVAGPRPETAAETRRPTDPPARVALAESDLVGETAIRPLVQAYYRELGYEPSIAGALVAVCDMFFGRILDGDVHPAVGVGCIGWYSWMTEDIPATG
jgi:hypothetical protein